jgi:hypothetical protein
MGNVSSQILPIIRFCFISLLHHVLVHSLLQKIRRADRVANVLPHFLQVRVSNVVKFLEFLIRK